MTADSLALPVIAEIQLARQKPIVIALDAEMAQSIQAKNAMTAIPQTEMVAVQLAKNPKLAMKFVLLP